jgi:catechol 2,3-dioxygenase-like lactoylglutathione lyase family enzyme
MPTKFTVTIDCLDPERMVQFWSQALGYTVARPPEGFDSWWSYWKSRGLPDQENYTGNDVLVDPSGAGPRFWFHIVPEEKVVKNRLHLDLHESGQDYTGGRREIPFETRKQRVDAAADRLVALGARILEVSDASDFDHYAVLMQDPEGNEFDVN